MIFSLPGTFKRFEKMSDSFYQKMPSKIRDYIESEIWSLLVKTRRRFFNASYKNYTNNNDLSMSYIEMGNRKGPILLMLHGFANNKDSYMDCAQYLKEVYRIIIPDIPGFGDSTCDSSITYNLNQYSKWMMEFINYVCDNEKIHITGNSLGGAIALQLVLDQPDKFASLTLINSAGIRPKNVKSLYDELLNGKNLFEVHNYADFNELLNRLFVRKFFIPTPIKFFFLNQFLKNIDWYKKLMNDLTNNIHLSPDQSYDDLFLNKRLNEIKIPVHLLWGDSDTLFPKELVEDIKELIPHATYRIFRNLGHCPQMEDSKYFGETLKEKLRNTQYC